MKRVFSHFFRRYATTLIAALLLAVFSALVWSAAARKSETFDEGLFIAGGVAQVERANPNIDLSHPPLLRWLAGVSAVALGDAKMIPEPPPFTPLQAIDLRTLTLSDQFTWSQKMLYADPTSHDRLLFWGRFPFALLTVLTGVLIFLWARRHFGDAPALGTLALFLFTPEVLAHSQWAHSDIAASLMSVLVAIQLGRTLENPSRQHDLLLAGSLGLSVGVKLTLLALVPVCVVLLAIADIDERRTVGAYVSRYAGRFALILGVVWIAIFVAHLPRPRVFAPHAFQLQDLSLLVHSPPDAGLTQFLQSLLGRIPLPDNFLKGVVYTLLLAKRGQIAYFRGHIGNGWWYYYPVAIVLKYPSSTLVLALLGLAAFLRSDLVGWPHKVAWTVVPATVLVLAMMNRFDAGVRTVLPLAPFYALWAGAAFHRYRKGVGQWAVIGLFGVSILSGILAYPNFLSYFNPLAGGTKAADHWLVDSNYDWGQSLPQLKEALDRRGIERVHLAYFGMARPEHYGIEALPADVKEPGWYAISRSYLAGWWPPGDPYGWLRKIPPEELPGGSIALIRVRETCPERLLPCSPPPPKTEAGRDPSPCPPPVELVTPSQGLIGKTHHPKSTSSLTPTRFPLLCARISSVKLVGPLLAAL